MSHESPWGSPGVEAFLANYKLGKGRFTTGIKAAIWGHGRMGSGSSLALLESNGSSKGSALKELDLILLALHPASWAPHHSCRSTSISAVVWNLLWNQPFHLGRSAICPPSLEEKAHSSDVQR